MAAALLALIVFAAPGLGVPNEYLLQDTFKSMLVAFGALGAALVFFWARRDARELRWHAALWLPLLLLAHALGSMAWSHPYLAGVEAIRWFLFTLIAWLALQLFTRERLPWLAWGAHAGALLASAWAAAQFWLDASPFPQGPNPASTFINRNFFAEFAVMTIPLSMLLLARARQSATVALLASSNAFVVVALMMTGTRSALVALWLLLLVVLPLAAWRSRAALPASRWPMPVRWLAAAIAVATVLGLGSIPSGNAKILGEERGRTAIERALKRTASISPDDRSLGLRQVMWGATGRMIQHHPLAGVGAGAWEVHVPPYLPDGEQIETDYYVHNEVLQLLAEDGLVGALFLAGLVAWLLRSAWRTWQAPGGGQAEEAAWRAVLLASLLALLLVCNAGFPWRLASTGALFALLVGALAASDGRLGLRGRTAAAALPWRRGWSGGALAATVGGLALATYISAQAVACEGRIVRAAQIALQITQSGRPNDPRWAGAKQQMLQLTREAVAINPHYRKITPMVADELARWGDWKDATWIWESVLSSRPEIPAILANAARGHAVQGEWDQAQQLLERAKRLAPEAPSVLSLEVIVLSRTGHEAEALDVARRALAKGRYDFDLLNAAFLLGWRAGDLPFAEAALLKRVAEFPDNRVQGLVDLGGFYAGALHDDRRALLAWREALRLAGPQQRDAVLQRVPAGYRDRL